MAAFGSDDLGNPVTYRLAVDNGHASNLAPPRMSRMPAARPRMTEPCRCGRLDVDRAMICRLAVAEDGTVRAGDARPGDELLADACDAVREHLQGRNVRQVIGGLSHQIGGSWNRVVDRLIGAGVLGRDRPSLLRPTRHPVLDTAARQAVLDQIRAAAAGEGPVSSQVAVVLALIGPCRLLERVAPDPGTRGEAKRRIDRVTAETPFAPGVAKIVDELIVAITVRATTIPPSLAFLAAATSSSSGPGGSPACPASPASPSR
jgi:hypothetical protein